MGALRPAKQGGGILRTIERTGMTRGLMGGSRGWFYVGTGLWTLRKVRSLAQRQPEILLREELRPGERMTIANGVATIASEPVPTSQLSRRGRRARRRAEQQAARSTRRPVRTGGRRARRRARREALTRGDLR